MADSSLYFAYGSNLNSNDWRRWCRDQDVEHLADELRFVGTATLPDRRLAFTRRSAVRGGGVLDVVPAPGHVVEGGLFEADETIWDLLDTKEGAPLAYRRIPVTVFVGDGRAVQAHTYEVLPERRLPYVDPTEAYLKAVVGGCAACGIPVEPLRTAATGGMPEPAVEAFFVYGTLMRGEARFPAIARHGIRGALLARMPGRLVSLGSWPGMLEGEGWVQGELLRVEDVGAAIADLDAIEGFRGYGADGSLFVRVLVDVDVDVGDGRMHRCWSYRYVGAATGEPIPSGDWRKHRGVRESFLTSLLRAYVRPEQERSVARRILSRGPFPPVFDVEDVLDGILPLASALLGGGVSERDLVLATRRLGVVPRNAGG